MGKGLGKAWWRRARRAARSGMAIAMSMCMAMAMADPGPLAPRQEGGPPGRGAPEGEGARLSEGDGALAARAAARVVAVAGAAQAAGMRSDPASLARMGGLPAALVKWGQVKSPWDGGRFLDIERRGEGKSARIAVVAPGIPGPLCKDSILDLAMRPEIERVEAGSWSLEVGEPWKIQDVDGLCLALAAGPVKMWARQDEGER